MSQKSPFRELSLLQTVGACLGMILLLALFFSIVTPTILLIDAGPQFDLLISVFAAMACVFLGFWIVDAYQLKKAESILRLVLSQEVVDKELTDAATAASGAIKELGVRQLRSTDRPGDKDVVRAAGARVRRARKRFRTLHGIFSKYGYKIEGDRIDSYVRG